MGKPVLVMHDTIPMDMDLLLIENWSAWLNLSVNFFMSFIIIKNKSYVKYWFLRR